MTELITQTPFVSPGGFFTFTFFQEALHQRRLNLDATDYFDKLLLWASESVTPTTQMIIEFDYYGFPVQVLENLLRRYEGEKILFHSFHAPYNEVLLGFNALDVETLVPFETFRSGRDVAIVEIKTHHVLPIESVMLTYALYKTGRCNLLLSQGELQETIELLRMYGPRSSLDRMLAVIHDGYCFHKKNELIQLEVEHRLMDIYLGW